MNHSVILEQHTDTFPIMHPPNRLRKHAPNIQHLQLRTPFLMFLLRHTVRHDHLIQRAGIDPLDCIARKHAVGQQRVDFRGALLLEECGGAGDGVGGVGEVVDEDGEARGDVADEHHGGVLAVGDFRGAAFLGGMLVTGREDGSLVG